MNEYEAKFELLRLGIQPSRQLIQDFIKAEAAERADELERARIAPEPQPRSDGRKRGSSKSILAKTLKENGERYTKQIKRGQPGRPRIVAEWFPEVSASMATGLSLPQALKKHGITLDAAAVRALYRNRALKEMREKARDKYLKELRRAGYELIPESSKS